MYPFHPHFPLQRQRSAQTGLVPIGTGASARARRWLGLRPCALISALTASLARPSARTRIAVRYWITLPPQRQMLCKRLLSQLTNNLRIKRHRRACLFDRCLVSVVRVGSRRGASEICEAGPRKGKNSLAARHKYSCANFVRKSSTLPSHCLLSFRSLTEGMSCMQS